MVTATPKHFHRMVWERFDERFKGIEQQLDHHLTNQVFGM
jgi:hypothetical protein